MLSSCSWDEVKRRFVAKIASTARGDQFQDSQFAVVSERSAPEPSKLPLTVQAVIASG